MNNSTSRSDLIKHLSPIIAKNTGAICSLEDQVKKHLDSLTTLVSGGSKLWLPKNYENTVDGLFITKKTGEIKRICATPIIPFCIFSNFAQNEKLSLGLATVNLMGVFTVRHVAINSLGYQGDGIRSLVSAGFGLFSHPSAIQDFERFIFDAIKLRLPKVLTSDAMGFAEDLPAFLHGDLPIVRDVSPFISMHPASGIGHNFQPSGSHTDWMALIKDNVHGCQQVFALCASFASMLLPLTEMDLNMFHFCGDSSTGKTILLQLAMSVHGNGVESSQGKSKILRWNTTPNALEYSLSTLSGLVACIDELGTYSGGGFSNTLYNITSGQSKARLGQSQKLQDQFYWSTLILSTGEISIAEKLVSSGESLSGGIQHRAISIDIAPEDAYALLDEDAGISVDQVITWAENLKYGLAKHYGTAGKLFMSHFLSQKDEADDYLSMDAIRSQLLEKIAETQQWLIEEIKDEDLEISGIQHRGLKRFALVLVSGLLAIQWGALPFSEEYVRESIRGLALQWIMNDQHKHNPAHDFLRKLRSYLLSNINSSFPILDDKEGKYGTVLKPLGAQAPRTRDILIYCDKFIDFCEKNKNIPYKLGVKWLFEAGYLRVESQGHYHKRKRAGMEQSHYHIKRSFIDSDIE